LIGSGSARRITGPNGGGTAFGHRAPDPTRQNWLEFRLELPEGGTPADGGARTRQYTRGSSTARYMVGFGAGMPRVRVRGKMTEWGGAKPLCLFEIERAGDWFGSGFTSSKTLQTHAGIELAEDVAAFIAKATKHEKINYR